LSFCQVVLAVTLLAHCSKPGPSKTPAIYMQPEIETRGGRENLVSLLDAVKIDCDATAAACPSTVGMVLSQRPMKSGLSFQAYSCTGTLIDKDTILTASHCIPDEVKKDPSLCGDRVGFSLGRKFKDNPKTIIYDVCSELVFATVVQKISADSDLDQSKPLEVDYAIFKISRNLTLTPRPLSQDRSENIKQLSLYVVDPLPTKGAFIRGTIRKKFCDAQFNGNTNASVSTGQAGDGATSAFTDLSGQKCFLMHGNSGSAILSGKGEVVGVLDYVVRERKNEKPTDKAVAANVSCSTFDSQLKKNFDFCL
jgi:V8-like Glu-specific endopeptidase